MNKPIIFLVIISAFFLSRQSMACSCISREKIGFFPATETKILPSNAKGLLFTRFEFEEPIRSADFLIVDETSGKKLSAKVVELDLDFVPDGHAHKATQIIYRIEPSKPFTQGHTYKFTFEKTNKFDGLTKQSQTVSISKKTLPIKSLNRAKFSFIDKSEIRTIRVEMGISCDESIDALVQEIAYDFPPELKEFQDSILFFTAYSRDSKKFRIWQYKRSMCSPKTAGRSDYAFGHDLIYIAKEEQNEGQLERGIQYSIKGTWLAPEIEDKLHSSKEYPLTYAK